MNLLQWDFKQFLLKFMSVQGGAISALITTRTIDPWLWANCLFVGVGVALGVDTASWLVKSKQADQPEE